MRTARRWGALALVLSVACSGDKSEQAAESSGLETPDETAEDTETAAPPEPSAPAEDAAVAEAPPPDAAPPPEGHDFIDQARLLYRVAACNGIDGEIPELPEHIHKKSVEAHCRGLRRRMKHYRDDFAPKVAAYLHAILPEGPPEVVYPFGGGDLISALVAFPDAPVITTISLELAGDPRRIDTVSRRRLRSSLGALSVQIGGMLSVGSNTSENLSTSQENELPAQLSSFLMALAVHGKEPVSVRYFLLSDDGSIDYLDLDEIEELDADEARRLRYSWRPPNFSPAFANVEIQYRDTDDPDGEVQIHRHIAWNLADDKLADRPQLILHLEKKGDVRALVKGASYLLWRRDFGDIRDYLLRHMAFLLSDSTGIPPKYAEEAGFRMVTYGRFKTSFLGASERHNRDFRRVWARNDRYRLPFRYGYIDGASQNHLVLTIPRDAPDPGEPPQ